MLWSVLDIMQCVVVILALAAEQLGRIGLCLNSSLQMIGAFTGGICFLEGGAFRRSQIGVLSSAGLEHNTSASSWQSVADDPAQNPFRIQPCMASKQVQ